jgi:hypothetical protein
MPIVICLGAPVAVLSAGDGKRFLVTLEAQEA